MEKKKNATKRKKNTLTKYFPIANRINILENFLYIYIFLFLQTIVKLFSYKEKKKKKKKMNYTHQRKPKNQGKVKNTEKNSFQQIFPLFCSFFYIFLSFNCHFYSRQK